MWRPRGWAQLLGISHELRHSRPRLRREFDFGAPLLAAPDNVADLLPVNCPTCEERGIESRRNSTGQRSNRRGRTSMRKPTRLLRVCGGWRPILIERNRPGCGKSSAAWSKVSTYGLSTTKPGAEREPHFRGESSISASIPFCRNLSVGTMGFEPTTSCTPSMPVKSDVSVSCIWSRSFRKAAVPCSPQFWPISLSFGDALGTRRRPEIKEKSQAFLFELPASNSAIRAWQ